MNDIICPGQTSTPLPEKHFAILFEGGWVFKPDYGDSSRIIATSPIVDGHACEFGLWDGKNQNVAAIPPFSVDMQPGTALSIQVEGDLSTDDDFTAAFDKAAGTYPFAYVRTPSAQTSERIARSQSLLRMVSLPVPTEIRAAGAMVSAEIGGPHKGQLFGGLLTVKRTFVTFLFIYEYECSLTATIDDGCGNQGCITGNDATPTPHLVFEIFPVGSSMKMFGQSVPFTADDQSCQKVHANDTFELLRQFAGRGTMGGGGQPLDIALYHNEGDLSFDCGDTGLTAVELGLVPKPFGSKGTKFPACASGSIVAR